MGVILKNNAVSTITTTISASDVGIAVATGTGSLFPTLGAGDYFYATLVSSGGTYEVVKVTARVGDTMTIARAQEGTTAQSFTSGSRIEVRVTAASITDMVDEHDQASEISIADAGGYYTGTNVEAALQEVGADFTALAAASGSSLVGYNQGGSGAVNRTVEARLRDFVSVKDFGAVGDGVTDDTAAIQAALDYVGSVGGGSVFVPAGDYMTTASIQVKSNTTVEFAGWIKPTAVDPYHAAIMGDPAGASNVTLMNPQVDGGGLAPLSGIIIRDDNTEFRVIGGLIKDCQHDTTDKGGRGINIEVGAGSATDPVNITVTGTVIQDCYAGVSCSGGSTQRQSNVSIANLTIENCQSALQFFGNSAGYPHDGGEMQYALTNISARNCGVSTSYTREQGVINSDRGSNITLSNFYVYNDPTYGAVGSLWRGDANNCLISNVTFEGDCNAGLLDFSSYAEANSFPLAANSSLDSDFVTIRQLGTCDETITLPISSASYLQNCRFDLITDTVTSGAPGTAQTANKTNCRMTVYNKTENAFVAGFLSDIGSVTFAEWTDKFYPADSFAARAWGLFDGTNGTMARSFNATSVRNSAGDYTVSFGSTAPVVSYVVTASFAAATASDQVLSIQNKTQNDFDIFTYSGGVATDMPTINFAVYW